MQVISIRSSVLLLSAATLLTACTLDDPDPSTGAFPITLEANQDLSLTRLSWTPVKVTGFKEYILLQSTEEIPTSPVPEVTPQVIVLKRIDDADITSFATSDILFAPRICYKLYVSIDDRFIQSQNICVDQEFKIFSGFNDRAAHQDGNDEMIFFDRLDQRFSIYNYIEEEITHTVSNADHSFPIMEISSSGGTTHLFAYDQSPSRLRKYTYPGLTLTGSKDFGNILFFVKPFKEFLLVGSENGSGSLKVLSRSNLIELESEEGLTGNRNVAVFDGDPVIVLDINNTSIKRFSLAPNGQVTELETKSPGIFQPSNQNFSAQGSEIFIAGRIGNIIDKNGDHLGALESNINSFISMMRLSADEKKVAYIVSDNASIHIDVADISNLQDIETIASYNIPFANYADMFIAGDIIYVAGVSFDSGQAQTFVLKFPMP